MSVEDELTALVADLGAEQVAAFSTAITTLVASAVAQGEVPSRAIGDEAVRLVDGLVQSGLVEWQLGRAWYIMTQGRAAHQGSIKVPAGCPDPDAVTIGDLHQIG